MPVSSKVFTLRDWAQLLVAMAGVVAVVMSITGWILLQWTEWRDIPSRIIGLEDTVSILAERQSLRNPQAINFKGSGIVAPPGGVVEAGENLAVTFLLRKTVSCRSDIVVRFFNHDSNLTEGQYSYVVPVPAIPVSIDYSIRTWSLTVPDDLPTGDYSYSIEFIPHDCGIYSGVQAPLSLPFHVVNPDVVKSPRSVDEKN